MRPTEPYFPQTLRSSTGIEKTTGGITVRAQIAATILAGICPRPDSSGCADPRQVTGAVETAIAAADELLERLTLE